MTLGGFFGGSKGVNWPDQPPKQIVGTITAVHPPEAVNDPKTGLPTDRQQVRIEIVTDERDPEIQFDDGARTLYVKSYMRSAIGDALRRVGAREPEVGGKLLVKFVRTEPADRPGLSPSKHFEAAYEAPPTGVADHFGTQAVAPAPQIPAAVPQIPAAVQAAPQIPAAVQAAFPTATVVSAPQIPAEPVKPAAISDAAWAAMDLATRTTVAATMNTADKPPY